MAVRIDARLGAARRVPDGSTVLWAGDVVTAFGTAISKERMIERMNAGADEPSAEIFLDLERPDSTTPDS